MTSTVAVAIRDVTALIEADDFRTQLAAVLPENVSVDRFVRVTRTAVIENPDLVQLDRGSLLSSALKCAADGLLPDGREAAFVAFGKQVSYMPMVGGLRKIAAFNGFAINAQVVYAKDEFSYELAPMPTVHHRPPALGAERGDPIGAYAIAQHALHGQFVEVMGFEEIEKVRAVSRAKGSGPWSQWWGEMARKTVVRRLWKQLPFGAVDERAAAVIDAVDEDTVLDDSPPAMPALVGADAAFDDVEFPGVEE